MPKIGFKSAIPNLRLLPEGPTVAMEGFRTGRHWRALRASELQWHGVVLMMRCQRASRKLLAHGAGTDRMATRNKLEYYSSLIRRWYFSNATVHAKILLSVSTVMRDMQTASLDNRKSEPRRKECQLDSNEHRATHTLLQWPTNLRYCPWSRSTCAYPTTT